MKTSVMSMIYNYLFFLPERNTVRLRQREGGVGKTQTQRETGRGVEKDYFTALWFRTLVLTEHNRTCSALGMLCATMGTVTIMTLT